MKGMDRNKDEYEGKDRTSGLRARPQSPKLAQDGRPKPGRDWDESKSWQG